MQQLKERTIVHRVYDDQVLVSSVAAQDPPKDVIIDPPACVTGCVTYTIS